MNSETTIESLAAKLGDLLKARGLTISTAESCTGGGIAALLTDIPGASEWFPGGFVTYSNEWKMKLLDVKQATLEQHGAVSSQTVGEMLDGLLKNGGADLGIAVSGIAGPGGGTPEKPVGTVYIGVAGNGWKRIERCQFSGSRADVRRATAETALEMMLEEVGKI